MTTENEKHLECPVCKGKAELEVVEVHAIYRLPGFFDWYHPKIRIACPFCDGEGKFPVRNPPASPEKK